MSTGGAVAVVPAFQTWALQFHVDITTASYLGSSQVCTVFSFSLSLFLLNPPGSVRLFYGVR